MSSTNLDSDIPRLWARISYGLEQEDIRPCKIHIMYNAMTDEYMIRVDHIPSKVSVAHTIHTDLLLDQIEAEVVKPIVTKMLEALTS